MKTIKVKYTVTETLTPEVFATLLEQATSWGCSQPTALERVSAYLTHHGTQAIKKAQERLEDGRWRGVSRPLLDEKDLL
jgi:hypothetical protein